MFDLPADSFAPGPGGAPITSAGLDGFAQATAALRPRSAQEAAAALAVASAGTIPVRPVGAGLHRHLDPPGDRPGWLMLSSGLDQILDHVADDLTITVQSGCPLGRIQRCLASRGQTLPHLPPFSDRATIGGLLATHLPGLTRMGHGPLRDRVLGMEVALSSGQVVKSGGRVVKNVTGYDLHRLHTGARGTLGFIVSVTLKVAPLPAVSLLLKGPRGTTEQMVRFARSMARSNLFPVAVIAGGDELFVKAEPLVSCRERVSSGIRDLAKAAGLSDLAESGDGFPEWLVDFSGTAGPGARAGLPPHACAAVLDLPGLAWRADLGQGLVDVRGNPDRVLSFAAACRTAGGWATPVGLERAGTLDPRFSPVAQRMEAIRKALDPAGVMNPGVPAVDVL